ncbi:MAG: c-type cytochrome [Gammaproteobacteria bacterium]
MRHPLTRPGFGLLLALVTTQLTAAELPSYDKAIVNTGYTLYQVHCASCHGDDATGGAVSGAKTTRGVPDLTRLAERNAGVLPFWDLYDVISGAELMPAHAGRTMPLWSQELGRDAAPNTDGAEQSLARGRILAIMAWLASVQTD